MEFNYIKSESKLYVFINNLFWIMHPTIQLGALSKRDAPAYIYFPPRYYVYLC